MTRQIAFTDGTPDAPPITMRHVLAYAQRIAAERPELLDRPVIVGTRDDYESVTLEAPDLVDGANGPICWTFELTRPFDAQYDYARAQEVRTCAHCGRPIEATSDGRWIDHASTPAASLVYCHDQDETHDGQRHTPTE